jgi:hypothetical protein
MIKLSLAVLLILFSFFSYSEIILAGGMDQFNNMINDFVLDMAEPGSKCEEYLTSKNITISESGFIANVAPSQRIRTVSGLIIDMNNSKGVLQAFKSDANLNKTGISQGVFFNYTKNTVWYVKKEQLRFKDSALRVVGKYVGNSEMKFTNAFNRVESVKIPIIDAICVERGSSNPTMDLLQEFGKAQSK